MAPANTTFSNTFNFVDINTLLQVFTNRPKCNSKCYVSVLIIYYFVATIIYTTMYPVPNTDQG